MILLLVHLPSQSEILDAYLDNEMDVIDRDYNDDGIIDIDETDIDIEMDIF